MYDRIESIEESIKSISHKPTGITPPERVLAVEVGGSEYINISRHFQSTTVIASEIYLKSKKEYGSRGF